MSTYGVDLYGRSKYGLDVYVEFDIEPFEATSIGYTGVALSWTAPHGSWSRLRVVRNRYGYAVDENDGEVLLDTAASVANLFDGNVVGGAWHYYTIFVQSNGAWYRSGTTSILVLKDQGYADRMFSLLPERYRLLPTDSLTDSAQENSVLRRYVQVLAMTLDYVKTFYDVRLRANDPGSIHVSDLAALAQQLGVQYESSTPPRLFRERLRNASVLGREKGTLEQIRSVISLTTGYDVDLELGHNLMLNEDQASFVHPVYPDWDPTFNYASGERVRYEGYCYQAKTGGAYGQSQAPAGTATDNTWWSILQSWLDTSLQDENGAISGWETLSFTTGVTVATSTNVLGVGVQSVTDSTVNSANAMVVRNTTSSAVSLGARSVTRLLNQSSMDPGQPITNGVPLPVVINAWDASVSYVPQDLVLYHGRAYQAKVANQGTAPSTLAQSTTEWSALSYDERVPIMVSMYSWEGLQPAGSHAYPFVEFYDEHGSLITTFYSDSLPSQVFDSFNANWGDLNTKATDVGGKTWTVRGGAFKTGRSGTGSSAYPTTSAGNIATVAGTADGQVSVTFVTSPRGSSKQGIIFRLSDTSNYLRAGRTALYQVSAGTESVIASYSQSMVDGDRLTVSFSGSSITVKRNGTTVVSATSSFNSTATNHGLGVI